jgi:hypothetical protein
LSQAFSACTLEQGSLQDQELKSRILNPSTASERECCADRIGEHPIVSQNAIRHRPTESATSIFSDGSDVEFRSIAFWSFVTYESENQRRQEHSKNIGSVLHWWKASGLVGTAQQVRIHNPLEILVLALDAIPGVPVRPYRQECEDRIDMTWLDNFTALRSLTCASRLLRKSSSGAEDATRRRMETKERHNDYKTTHPLRLRRNGLERWHRARRPLQHWR